MGRSFFTPVGRFSNRYEKGNYFSHNVLFKFFMYYLFII